MTLREQIADNHDKAERHAFVCQLLSGNISHEAYSEYLFNQAICYRALEKHAADAGLLDGIEDIRRAQLIFNDALELGDAFNVKDSTREYLDYLSEVPPNQLLAHIYVRHFADMYGGQLIKKVAPGSCTMYEFNDRAGLIAKVRDRLTDDLADEANVVFEYVLRLFDEIARDHNLHSPELSGA